LFKFNPCPLINVGRSQLLARSQSHVPRQRDSGVACCRRGQPLRDKLWLNSVMLQVVEFHILHYGCITSWWSAGLLSILISFAIGISP
jgi:hypothetical protein